MSKAQGPVESLGVVGRTLAANLRRLRAGMTYRELSDRLAELGRSIPVLGLSRIEQGARRVDVDDLIALALALNCSPLRLLLPPVDDGPVELTPTTAVLWSDAWAWTAGDAPLGEQTPERRLRWLLQNRRHDVEAIVEAWVAVVEHTEGYTVRRDECGRPVEVTGRVRGVRRGPDGRVEEYTETRTLDPVERVRLLLEHEGR